MFVFIATPIGIFLAVLLDQEMRGTRIYQGALFIPVVLSLAIVGFIWSSSYTSQGFINGVLGRPARTTSIDWLGNPSLNIWAVLVAAELAPGRLRDGPVPGRAQERRPDAP